MVFILLFMSQGAEAQYTREFDFGAIEAEEMVSRIIHLGAYTQSPPAVEIVRKSCNCTSAKVIITKPPGGRVVELEVRIDTSLIRYPGKKQSSIVLRNLDGPDTTTTLRLTYDVRIPLGLGRSVIPIGQIHRGSTLTVYERMNYDGKSGSMKANVAGDTDWISTAIVFGAIEQQADLSSRDEVTGDDHEPMYLRIDLDPTAETPSGMFEEQITLVTSDESKRASLHIKGTIVGHITVAPGILYVVYPSVEEYWIRLSDRNGKARPELLGLWVTTEQGRLELTPAKVIVSDEGVLGISIQNLELIANSNATCNLLAKVRCGDVIERVRVLIRIRGSSNE